MCTHINIVEKLFAGMRCRQGGLFYGKEVDRVARFSLFKICLNIHSVECRQFNGFVLVLKLLFNISVAQRQQLCSQSTLNLDRISVLHTLSSLKAVDCVKY